MAKKIHTWYNVIQLHNDDSWDLLSPENVFNVPDDDGNFESVEEAIKFKGDCINEGYDKDTTHVIKETRQIVKE